MAEVYSITRDNRKWYVPASWSRLLSLIKHQALSASHNVIFADFGGGKSSFIEIVERKLRLEERYQVSIISITPLTRVETVLAVAQKELSKETTQEVSHLILVDDCHDASEEVLAAIQDEETCSWFLFSEPLLSERLFSDVNRFNLPSFKESECHEYLMHQLAERLGNVELSRLQTDAIWAEANGLPGGIVEQANAKMSSLLHSDVHLERFESSNSSWLSTLVLAFGVLVFIGVLVYKLVLSEDETEEPVEIMAQKVEFIEASDKLDLVPASQELDADVTQEDAIEQFPDFSLWLKSVSKDSYTVQLFSHQNLAEANTFQQSLDLADSYIVVNKVQGKKRYRVIWGSFVTRAEAQSALNSLPEYILEQKPWIRTLAVMLEEI